MSLPIFMSYMNYWLVLGSNSPNLLGYSDADGETHEGCYAISSYLFMLLGSAISWSSKWQSVVALSTSEAEYIVLSHAAREAIWLHNLISQAANSKMPLVMLFCDNQLAINLAKNDKFCAHTRHINKHYHYIQKCIEDKKILVKYTPTDEQLAALLTKALTI